MQCRLQIMFFAIPLGELKTKIKKWRYGLKFVVPSAILKLFKAYLAIPLSGQANLVRRYL
jgi:hypothetical protein